MGLVSIESLVNTIKIIERNPSINLAPEFKVHIALEAAKELKTVYPIALKTNRTPCNRVYPYLLKQGANKVDEAWCVDITYLPIVKGYAYLIAILEIKTRNVLGWKLSIA